MKRLWILFLMSVALGAASARAAHLNCSDESGVGVAQSWKTGSELGQLNLFLGTDSRRPSCTMATLDTGARQAVEIQGGTLKLNAKDAWAQVALNVKLAPGHRQGTGFLTLKYKEGQFKLARENVAVKCLFEGI